EVLQGGRDQAADEVLLERIAAGDVDAFDDFYDRYAAYVNGVCYHFLRDSSEAEEVMQEVFLSIWEGRSIYDPKRAKVTTWLFWMARNRCLDRLRAASRQIPHMPVPADLRVPEGTDPESGAAASERRLRVYRALAALPPEQREAIEQCFFRSANHREAAQRLGVPLGTLKGRIRLAMDKLAALLGDEEERK
ncbi:MAG: sigma-70 family RNA polymerase sigma factor, partial [Candidatus Dadabacteria bacterium]